MKRSLQEQKIINAATHLFLKRGYENVTVRDIAKDADVNVAMLNYYFKSKDKLVELIIDEMIKHLYAKLNPIINSDQELNLKISTFVSHFIDELSNEPGMILFLLSVLKNTPDILQRTNTINALYDVKVFFKQIESEVAKGTIRKINPEHFYLSILSLILFPFSIIDVISDRNDYSSRGVVRFVKARKEMIVIMIQKYLEPEQK